VWLTGHDHDVRRELPDVHGPRDRWLVRRAIRGADAIVTQTRAQQERLRADWGLESTVIMNSVELPPEATLGDGAGTTVLWLSTYKPEKRPEWFVRFAERHPDVRCRMVGVVPETAAGAGAFAAARARAERVPNLSVEAAVPRGRIDEVFAGVAVFAHSSPAEGFPNTLLESWARAVPTVSCFDPDTIVERERLGAARTDQDRWEQELVRRVADPTLRRDEGHRARAWAAAHHAPEVVHEQLAQRLGQVLGGR
jgi:glycosyltransferase involved in cell wall biosynthesis